MQRWRIIGLIVAGIACCGAGNTEVDALLSHSMLVSIPEAARVADEVLKKDANSGDAYALRGFVKYSTHDVRGAIIDCTTAIKSHPRKRNNLRTAYNFRYHSYIELGQWKEALADCLECLKIRQNAKCAHDAAILCHRVGDDKQSKYYAKLCETLLKHEELERQELQQEIRDSRDPAKAMLLKEKLEAIIRKHPDDLRLRLIRAACLETMHKTKEACAELTDVIAKDPSLWAAYLYRAHVYKTIGDIERYDEDIERASELGYRKEHVTGQQSPQPIAPQPD